MNDSDTYYCRLADYYNHEACTYEERYWSNVVAQRIRQAFREEVKAHAFSNVLEIGCGTGLDLSHFGSIYPERRIYGIDVAPAMVASAREKVRKLGLENVRLGEGTPDDLEALFPEVRFDLIYVFFGALNTVPDLNQVAALLRRRLKPNGAMVLTFVNKWYLAETLIHLAKFRFERAFRRMGKVWRGYSDINRLESRCFSPGEISQAFRHHFVISRRRGYSILYPAWYRAHLVRRFGNRVSDILWGIDAVLNRTPAWCFGEYALYVLRAKESVDPK